MRTLFMAFLVNLPLAGASFGLAQWNDSFDDSSGIGALSTCYRTSGHIELDCRNTTAPHAFPANASTVWETTTITKGYTYPVTFPQTRGTVEFWVNGAFSETQYVGNLFDSYATDRNHMVVRSYGQYQKSAQVYFYDTAASAYAFAFSFNIPPGKWNLLTITWDAGEGWAEVFLNGVFLTHGTIKAGWIPAGQRVLFGSGFSGSIAQARILSVPLTLAEVRRDWGNNHVDSGIVTSIPITPANLSAWDTLRWNRLLPVGTGIKIRVESADSNNWQLVPDSYLPGNSAGLTAPRVSLRTIPAATYKKLRLNALLTTTDSLRTPELTDWSVSWRFNNDVHPRLFMTAAKRDSIKQKISSQINPFAYDITRIRLRADKYVNEIPPARDNVIILDDNNSRPVGDKLRDLLTAYVFSGDTLYRRGVRRWTDSILAYPYWGANRDLGAGHILCALSLAYDWMYQEWTPAERIRLEDKIIRHADTLCREGHARIVYLQNHNHIRWSSVMAAAVATYDVNPYADQWITGCRDNFTATLAKLSPDGASVEELAYHAYGLQAMLNYFALEESVLKVDRVTTSDFMKNTWKYRLYGSWPDLWHVAEFGDNPGEDYGGNCVLHYLASKFDNPYAQWLAFEIRDRRISHMVSDNIDFRNLTWYDPAVGPMAPYNLPAYQIFPNMELFTSRSVWNDDNAVYFATKANPPYGQILSGTNPTYDQGAGHQHPDKGHFILKAFGRNLLTDDFYAKLKKTAAHNIVTFDGGRGQKGEGSDWYLPQEFIPYTDSIGFTHTEFMPQFEYLVARLRGAYDSTLLLNEYFRHFVFLRKKALLIIDELNCDTSHHMEWRIHTKLDSSLWSPIGNRMDMTLKGSGTGFRFENLLSALTDSAVVDTYKQTASDGQTLRSRQLVLHKTGKAARFEVLLRPFQTTPPESAVVTHTVNDTLVVTTADFTVRVHTPSRNVRLDTLPLGFQTRGLETAEPEGINVHPNPFNPTTRIIVRMGGTYASGSPFRERKPEIRIFNSIGSLVQVLTQYTVRGTRHEFDWNGTDLNNRSMASGLYLARVTLPGGKTLTQTFLLIR